MADPKLTDIMRRLGYTQHWLDVGVVDEASVRSQFDAFRSSADQNTEHYRHRAFVAFLHRREQLAMDEALRLLALDDAAANGTSLRVSRAIQLLACDLLTDAQFAELAEHPALAHPSIQRVYRRQFALRRLRTERLTPTLFHEVQSTDDGAVHRGALQRDDLTRDQLEWLAANGATRAVRNVAKQRLRRRQPR